MKKPKKEVTIYDIAEKLGLATSTISRALKDHHSIGKKTTEKVKRTAEEMGFRPNIMAASLRNKKTRTIGVLIPRINRPFMASLVSGIEGALQKQGYNVIIIQSNDSYENEVEMMKVLYNNRVSGVICSVAMETQENDHFQQFLENGVPIIFVDRTPKDIACTHITIDNYAAGYEATEHLIEQGCKRIAHFSGSKFRMVYSERERGYIDALKDHGLKVDADLIIPFKTLSYEEAETITSDLLDSKNPPDGIFASNDTTAVAAIQVAKKKNVKIPQDLAVIGFNNDPISKIVDPALSTIDHPAFKMGETAAEKILNQLQTKVKSDLKEITVLNTELIIRESSKRK
ncbi:LacI family DNA-binding transcriptional regulator [Maribacter sp. TH_r10]|uniref:LacI family DNA-binding transcriptional regulator n=1 Tax=Maribacter sp. TH_r10 TaxID=3082086 RepID=UPI002953489C|nr:LacI family DNA-binding transcriptional regulator [Maribacter sp. TH_r10]MDV7139783.1 LacI family DNA-binding transcriptional regulator [Maribacter sp. TH_r10]